MPVSCERRAQADVAQARGDMEAAQACRLPHGGLLVLRYLAPGLPWAQLEVLLGSCFMQPMLRTCTLDADAPAPLGSPPSLCFLETLCCQVMESCLRRPGSISHEKAV